MAFWVPSGMGAGWWYQNSQYFYMMVLVCYLCNDAFIHPNPTTQHSRFFESIPSPYYYISPRKYVLQNLLPLSPEDPVVADYTILSFTYSPPSLLSDCQPPHSCESRCCYTPQGTHIVPALYLTDTVQFRGTGASHPQTSSVSPQLPQHYT